LEAAKFSANSYKCMNDNSKPYHDAFDAYQKDIEQIASIADRLIASAKETHADKKMKATAKLDKLKRVDVQFKAIMQTRDEARSRYDAAIDALDEKSVLEIRGLCAYADGTGRGSAATRYLLEECKAYEAAKGDYKLRHQLWGQIVDVLGTVADAVEGKKSSAADTSVLAEYEALEGEDATAFYKANEATIKSQLQARFDSNQP
jgi:hypothetical protein